MTPIEASHPIHKATINLFDASKFKAVHVSELPEDQYQTIMNARKSMLEFRHTVHPDMSDHPFSKAFATVKVGGETIATVHNTGGVSTSNGLGGQVQRLMSEMDPSLSGPAAAQKIAKKIADHFNGVVEKSATAITQGEYHRTEQPLPSIDYDAMENDPVFHQIQQLEQARTAFLAQQIAQSEELLDTQDFG